MAHDQEDIRFINAFIVFDHRLVAMHSEISSIQGCDAFNKSGLKSGSPLDDSLTQPHRVGRRKVRA